jgi:ATP-binding cassette, subfamily B, bacterial MsbA
LTKGKSKPDIDTDPAYGVAGDSATPEGLRAALTIWTRLMKFHKPRIAIFALTVVFIILSTAFNALSLATIVPFTEIVLRGDINSESEAVVAADTDSPASSVMDLSKTQTGAALKEKTESIRHKTVDSFYGLIRGKDKLDTLLRFCIALVLIFLLKNIFWYAQSYLSVYLEQAAVRDIRDQLFTRYEHLSLDYYQGLHSGVLVSRITNDTELARGAVANGLMELLRHVFLLFAYIGLILFTEANMFMWTILILAPSIIMINKLGQMLRRISRVSQEMMARLTAVVGETVRGIRIIKAFGVENHQAARFHKETSDYCSTLVRMTRIGSLGMPLTEILAVSVACILIYIWGHRIIADKSDAGSFLLFLLAFTSMMRPIKAINQLNVRIQHGLAAGLRIFNVLDAQPTVKQPQSPVAIDRFKSAVSFEDVTFAYEADKAVLHKLNVTIPKGQLTALVGPSGAGKSTLINLIPRFYDPTEGRITIDGHDLKSLDIASLRKQIGVVTQETILFQDTIANNIRLGRLDASDENVIAAAKAANAHEFITDLEYGYQTRIGERGLRLSGGERQRLTIARAILKNPPILILDEATSALDTESERLVQDAIEHLVEDRTALVIAHRLSTIRRADCILAMSKGKVIEQGTHDELLAHKGLYHKLHEMQFAASSLDSQA